MFDEQAYSGLDFSIDVNSTNALGAFQLISEFQITVKKWLFIVILGVNHLNWNDMGQNGVIDLEHRL